MSRRECSPGSLVLARGLLNAGLPFDDAHHQGNLTLGRPALNVLLFLICHGLCHPLPPKITTLRVDLKIRGALYFALHEPEVHVGQRLHAREVLGDLPHLQSVHFSTIPAVGETGGTALEWAPRRPPRRKRSVLAAREDLSRHLGRDYPQPQGPFGYPWFSAFRLPCSQGGCSQGGRSILNFLLPRNDITTLCSTMKTYSKSPLTIA